MGAEHSVAQGEGEQNPLHNAPTFGYHVIKVQPSSPGEQAGLVPFFDFIVQVNDVILDKPEAKFVATLQENLDKQVKILIYNARTNTIRESIIVPSLSWGGQGLLGVSIHFSSVKDVNEYVYHVLEVYLKSPAQEAGLEPHIDYIVGTPELTFADAEDFFTLISAHQKKPLDLFVFNLATNSVRQVTISPNPEWGGEGSLGCDVGYGILHRIPTQQHAIQAEVEKYHQLKGSLLGSSGQHEHHRSVSQGHHAHLSHPSSHQTQHSPSPNHTAHHSQHLSPPHAHLSSSQGHHAHLSSSHSPSHHDQHSPSHSQSHYDHHSPSQSHHTHHSPSHDHHSHSHSPQHGEHNHSHHSSHHSQGQTVSISPASPQPQLNPSFETQSGSSHYGAQSLVSPNVSSSPSLPPTISLVVPNTHVSSPYTPPPTPLAGGLGSMPSVPLSIEARLEQMRLARGISPSIPTTSSSSPSLPVLSAPTTFNPALAATGSLQTPAPVGIAPSPSAPAPLASTPASTPSAMFTPPTPTNTPMLTPAVSTTSLPTATSSPSSKVPMSIQQLQEKQLQLQQRLAQLQQQRK